MSIYKKIKSLAIKRNLTIKDIENLCGLSNGLIKKWEESSPTVDMLCKVSNKLNVPLEYFLSDMLESNSPYKKGTNFKPSTLSYRIRSLCIENLITKKQLLEQFDMNINTIYDIEKRGFLPSPGKLLKIADFFDVSIDYLFGRTDSPKALYSSPDKLNLSSTEEHVVTTFRKLTPEDQNYIVKTIDIVSAQYPSEENTYDIAAFKSHKHINIEDEE